MIEISQERLDEVQAIKNEIGWSWDTVANRLGWTPHQMRQVRALRIPVADEHIAWLLAVKAAIDAIPVPGPEVFMPHTEQPAVVQDVKVMLLEDIAAKLVDEYFAIGEEATAEELAGARYMVGRLAERCGVAEEVREAIRTRQFQAATTLPSRQQFRAEVEGFAIGQPSDPNVVQPIAGIAGISSAASPAATVVSRPSVGNPFTRRERVPMDE